MTTMSTGVVSGINGYALYPGWEEWWITARFRDKYPHDIPTPGHLQVFACIADGLGSPWNIPTKWATADWYHTAKGAVSLSYATDLSTFDFDRLTRLVLAAHKHAVRVEISPSNMQRLRIGFWPRDPRERSISQRHPTLSDLAKQAAEMAVDAPRFDLLLPRHGTDGQEALL